MGLSTVFYASFHWEWVYLPFMEIIYVTFPPPHASLRSHAFLHSQRIFQILSLFLGMQPDGTYAKQYARMWGAP